MIHNTRFWMYITKFCVHMLIPVIGHQNRYFESGRYDEMILFLFLRTVRKASNIRLRIEIVHQIIFWLALFLFGLFRNYGEHDYSNFKEIFYYDLCHWIFQIVGANFIYFILIQKYFEPKKYAVFIIFFIAFIYVLGIVNRFFIVYVAEPFFTDYTQDSPLEILTDLKYLVFHYILPIISVLSFSFR